MQPFRSLAPVLAALVLAAAPARAPLGAQRAPSPTVDSTRAGAPLLTRRDLVMAGAFAAATVAMLPFDQRLTEALRDPGPQRSRLVRGTADAFNFLGDPGTVILSAGTYAAGRLGHWPRVAALGLHAGEAIVLSGVATGIVKGAVGRARPFVDADTNPRDFRPGRGFRDATYTSFPSGHATAAFATAAAVSEEVAQSWPHAARFVTPVMYAGASAVAVARLYTDKHWASDVVLGAGIGTFSGIKVVRYAYAHPGNRIERFFLGATAAPAADGGARLGWSGTW